MVQPNAEKPAWWVMASGSCWADALPKRALRPSAIVQRYTYQDTGVALCTGPVLTPLIGRAGVGL